MMSLVGSLEDLGLGDILQIISLSRKSGLLTLRRDGSEGRIALRDGQVWAATLKGGPCDLRDLVVGAGLVSQAQCDAALLAASKSGVPLEQALLEKHSNLSAEGLEELRRAAAEAAVMGVFGWPAGEFSFQVCDDPRAELDPGLFLSAPLNAQYLAMEGTRLSDEQGRAPSEEALDLEPGADADPLFGLGEIESGADELEAAASPSEVDPEATPVEDDEDAETLSALTIPPDLKRSAPPAEPPPVVVIDRDLAVLEWAKSVLLPGFPRVHIFQRWELGLGRIRQYFLRGEVPLVLVSDQLPPDAVTKGRGIAAMAERLRAQCPKAPVVFLASESNRSPQSPRGGAGVTGFVERPSLDLLADTRDAATLERCAAALREAGRRAGEQIRGARGQEAIRAELSPDLLPKLREASARLRNPSSRGAALDLVLRFASETFSRVALFQVGAEAIAGLAQIGVEAQGGPSDAKLRECQLPLRSSAWVRSVLDGAQPVRGAPTEPGDEGLAQLLGKTLPMEAYLAPIRCGDRIVALLYGDHLPERRVVGDTAALEILLHEAELVLDRQFLERVLARTDPGSSASS
jgi:hypothetical protein